MSKPLVSLVIPCLNEASGIKSFLDSELLPALEKIPDRYEVILVDDGSTDASLARARATKLYESGHLKLLALTRNFGKEIALTAGIREARGDAIILLDADGQHPVSAIGKMLDLWRSGSLIVTATTKEKKTRHRLGSRIFYSLMRLFGSRDFNPYALDFRLIDRTVADEFNRFTEATRLTRGLIDWLGFPQTYLEVRTKGRLSGKPSYSMHKLISLAGDSLASSSRTPLVIFGYLGVFITFFSLLLGLFILIEEYLLGDPLALDWSGAVAMSVFVSFLIGLVLISQAMTALYISQIHTESKNRPLYVIDRSRSSGLTSNPHKSSD